MLSSRAKKEMPEKNVREEEEEEKIYK